MVRAARAAADGAAPAWQVATLKPDDGDDALAKFRSNRFAGLLMFAACLGGRQRLRLLLARASLYLAADARASVKPKAAPPP